MTNHELPEGISSSRRVAITANMAALALIGNYALVFLPNMELGTSIIFITAFVFDLGMAIACVMIMSVIFGMVNPWGGFIPQIWLAQVFGWLFVALIGSLMAKGEEIVSYDIYFPLKMGFIGGVVTLFFDLSTNLGYSLAFGIPFGVAIITGFSWSLIHIASNILIFSQVVPTLETVLKNHFRYEIWSSDKHVYSEE
ncbi:hypothetical protein EU537_04600 [Candidatus Thorarchaeota archaeon]|nr:MAG: hypothetical protein EU537_04600 [Candidatus Thorarchaeota archaeon]